jgi:hypothetical protein
MSKPSTVSIINYHDPYQHYHKFIFISTTYKGENFLGYISSQPSNWVDQMDAISLMLSTSTWLD